MDGFLDEDEASDDGSLYGYPACPLRPLLMGRYCQDNVPVLTDEVKAFNKAMSEVRLSVECVFGDVANYFKFIHDKKEFEDRNEGSWQTIYS